MREKKARRKAAGRLIDVWVFGLTVVPSARTHLVSGAAKKGGGGGGGQVGRGSSWRGGGAWPVRTPRAPASRTPGPVRLLSMSGFCSLLRGAPPPTSPFPCWGGLAQQRSRRRSVGRTRRDCPALPTNTRMFSQSDCVIMFGIFPGKPPVIWPVTIRKMPIRVLARLQRGRSGARANKGKRTIKAAFIPLDEQRLRCSVASRL